MIKELLGELKKSCFSVLPIYALIMFLLLVRAISLSGYEIFSFSIATLFIIIGISLFNYGAEHAMTPIGVNVGKGLTKRGKFSILLIVVFAFGFFITVAEPDLSVLALQTKSIFPEWVLIISIGISVGIFLLLAILKILKKIDLIRILTFLYMICFAFVALLCFSNKDILVALCFDSGGVTTGPMTVPFLMAIGVGVASVIAQKSEKEASFGFIALASIGPIIVMLVMSLFTKSELTYEIADYTISDNFFLSYGLFLWEKFKGVGLAISLLLICFLVVDLLFLKLSKKRLLKLFYGLIFVFVGLVIFLAAVDCTYMGIGYKIGSKLAEDNIWIIVLIVFVIGALTVLAEPAIQILIHQVEEMTNGLVKKKYMFVALAFGVGIALSLAVIRIYFKIPIVYIIIPGYLICFILSFFVPKIYTAIAFDAGGVATGPLTSSFILPIALGLCAQINFGDTNNILLYGFGVVSLVALSPLLSIELLGVISNIVDRKKVRKAIKKVLEEDDKVLIYFGD